jgi:hypothetical protein
MLTSHLLTSMLVQVSWVTPVLIVAGTLRVPSAKNVRRPARRWRKEPGRLRVAAHNLREPLAVRPRVRC